VSKATVVSFGCRAGALATAVRVELQRRVVHGLWSPVAEWAAPSDDNGRVRCGHTHAVDPAIENYWRVKALVVSGMECNRPANAEYALQLDEHNGRPHWASAPAEHSPTALHLFYTTGAFGGSTDGWVIAASAPGANLTGMAGEFGAAQCRLERF
jgi:hypothetical protein